MYVVVHIIRKWNEAGTNMRHCFTKVLRSCCRRRRRFTSRMSHWHNAILRRIPPQAFKNPLDPRYSAPQSPIVRINLCPFDSFNKFSMSFLSWGLRLKQKTIPLSSAWSVIPKRVPYQLNGVRWDSSTCTLWHTDNNCSNKWVVQNPTCCNIWYGYTMTITNLLEKP